MTGIATRIAAVTLGAATCLAATSITAGADTRSWKDPKPNLTKVTVKHSGDTIKITTRTGAVRPGTYLTIYLDTDPDDPGPEYRTDLIPASELMPLMRVEKFGQHGTATSCDGLRGRADVYGPTTMSLTVPRSCVGNPAKVRVAVRGYFDVKGPNVIDWLQGKKTFTGWVRR